MRPRPINEPQSARGSAASAHNSLQERLFLISQYRPATLNTDTPHEAIRGSRKNVIVEKLRAWVGALEQRIFLFLAHYRLRNNVECYWWWRGGGALETA